MTPLTARDIAQPFGAYSHGVTIPSGWRIAVTSGQLPVTASGDTPGGIAAQAALCLENCGAILAEAGMGPGDVFRIAGFVTDRAHFPSYMAARDAWLGAQVALPTSTLVIVTGFTRPEFLVEVEIWAAAP
ncbi:MAG: RidA family protein [Pseudomonadota bacterium]